MNQNEFNKFKENLRQLRGLFGNYFNIICRDDTVIVEKYYDGNMYRESFPNIAGGNKWVTQGFT